MSPLQSKTVLVLGLGESGLAMARWCASEGATVRVADTRSIEAGGPPQWQALQSALPEVEVFLGTQWDNTLLDGVDIVAVSPGLSPLQAPQQGLLSSAQERAIPVWGEIELFAQKLATLKSTTGYAPKILAITGTNGKTTVTSLTGKLCQRAGLKTRVAGNISPAALDALTDGLNKNDLPQVWVLELSSFQLATTHSLLPQAAVVLNITQDHLDWHGDMDAYAAAKARIFAPDTLRILNRDDARVMAMLHSPSADSKAGAVHSVSFGLDAPTRPGQFGLLYEGGMRWLAMIEVDKDEEGHARPTRQKKLNLIDEPEPGLLKRLMPVDALKIQGEHNIANAMAALALCRAIDVPMASLLHGLRDYRGEPHRVELVMTVADIDYIDDSKGTNVGATVAALNGLGKGSGETSGQGRNQDDYGRIVLIAGGDGKGQDFSPLAQPVARHARAVILIGKDAPALRTALRDTHVPLTDCPNLRIAVETAAALALPGDRVLLSPACASLDMFRNYQHRADVFINAVRELALELDREAEVEASA
jgi:UDP-N-acetylmuramoylalanine--D-glutamate ligase